MTDDDLMDLMARARQLERSTQRIADGLRLFTSGLLPELAEVMEIAAMKRGSRR